MAIDTAQKRRSSAVARRLPWLRRFTLPVPDSSISQEDRQQLLGIYAGIAAGEEGEEAEHTCGQQRVLPTYNAYQRLRTSRETVVAVVPRHRALVGIEEC